MAQVGLKLNKQHSVEIIAENTEDSRNQIKRFIRLTNLISPLLDKVDERRLAFIPAVELSYLNNGEQEWLYNILCREEHFGVPLAIATKLKGIVKNGTLTFEKIDNIIVAKNQKPPKAVKISYRAHKDYFSTGTTPQEYEKVIKQALKEWFENHPNPKQKYKSKQHER